MKYSYNEANWENDQLFIRNKKTGVSLIPHEKHKKMYRIKWSDGTFGDFYNKTRAKDNATKATLNVLNADPRPNLKGRTQPQRSPLVSLND